MKEYIEREAIIKLSKEIKDNFAPLHQKVIDAFIYNIDKNIPTADVEPVRHGKWILAPYAEKCGNAYCSECNHFDWSDCKYCSECGAKMDGGKK